MYVVALCVRLSNIKITSLPAISLDEKGSSPGCALESSGTNVGMNLLGPLRRKCCGALKAVRKFLGGWGPLRRNALGEGGFKRGC